MKIAKNSVVALEVELSDLQGQLIDRTGEPVQYLHGGYGDIFAPVEAELEGKGVNHRVEVRLEPENAFGDYDENLLLVEERAGFPETLEVGMRFEGTPGSAEEGVIFTVTDIAGGKVVLDGNHPLAGIGLKFAATVLEIRPATPDEVLGGSAHDASSVLVRPLP